MDATLEFFAEIVTWLFSFFCQEFELFGFAISFWQIVLFVIVTSLIFSIIGALFRD